MIDFEDAKPRKWIAICKGVEAGAYDHVLRHASLPHRNGQFILGEPAPGDEIGAPPPPQRPAVKCARRRPHARRHIRRKHAQRHRIIEDERPVQKLVRGAMFRGAKRRAAAVLCVHAPECTMRPSSRPT